MKRTLCSIIAAIMTTAAHAAPLNPNDWMTIPNYSPPAECFTFSDGKLIATDNTSGKELFYKVTDETPLMLNGSRFSVTLQFDTATFLAEHEAELQITFHTDNTNRNGGNLDIFHRFYIRSDSGEINFYDSSSAFDDYHHLDPSIHLTTTVKVNYTIKDDHLCFNYELNGNPSGEYVFKDAKTDPSLAWRPCFGLSLASETVFTVTDVTLLAVPEPATATLSLLALAGLAARRRRK